MFLGGSQAHHRARPASYRLRRRYAMMQISLPMYDWLGFEAVTDAWCAGLARALARHGVDAFRRNRFVASVSIRYGGRRNCCCRKLVVIRYSQGIGNVCTCCLNWSIGRRDASVAVIAVLSSCIGKAVRLPSKTCEVHAAPSTV